MLPAFNEDILLGGPDDVTPQDALDPDTPDPDRPAANALAKAAGLACWSGPVTPEPLSGGLTNLNFVVEDGGQRYFVRIGEDIPIHGVLRFNERAAAHAAEMAGVSPALIYSEPGVLPTRFVDGRTYEAADLRVAEIPIPVPKANEVLVRVAATTVNRTDCAVASGSPWVMRLFVGITRPRVPVPGTDLAGEVVAVGDEAKEFSLGDRVWAFQDDGIASQAAR